MPAVAIELPAPFDPAPVAYPADAGSLDVFAVVVRACGGSMAAARGEGPEELTMTCKPSSATVRINSKADIGLGGGRIYLRKDRAGCWVSTSILAIEPGVLEFEVSGADGIPLLEGSVGTQGEAPFLAASSPTVCGPRVVQSCWKLECRLAEGGSPGGSALGNCTEVEVCLICRNQGQSLCLSEACSMGRVLSSSSLSGLEGIPEEDGAAASPAVPAPAGQEGVATKVTAVSRLTGGIFHTPVEDLLFDPMLLPQRFEETYRRFGGQGSFSGPPEEEMTWFNAGLRVGLGVGLGMCIGVGLGVGLMAKGYSTATAKIRGRLR
mmetsp:Transcript_31528/g.100533  ORF Transcript_31528/g.100533 Transcript_31528/m.100533 type:complete len:322 (-) Transcript_31528:185-1150(-)